MPQKNVVVIGANEYQLPLVLKARSRGYRTHVFAWEEGAVARPYADVFYPISITETGQNVTIFVESSVQRGNIDADIRMFSGDAFHTLRGGDDRHHADILAAALLERRECIAR